MTECDIIESIREEYTGLRDAPRISLANGVKTLAEDLYAKDTHFIFELIQNAEDNEYAPGVAPKLRFELCQQELDSFSGPMLVVHNNEIGFQDIHVKAICLVGQSTKQKTQEYIGEKGIGFKSVFRITTRPYIISNQFQFCLPEHDEQTGLGYIVPHWAKVLPTGIDAANGTTIVLPIDKGDKALQTVNRALRDIAPETILFLKKIRSVEISVQLPGIEYEIIIEKSILAVADGVNKVQLTHLRRAAGIDDVLESSNFWVTEVEFAKPDGVGHEKREGIARRSVSVAIPLQIAATSGVRREKLFAYLPVWEDTGLPFIINADFLLVSSREGVREDEDWNKWLRTCVVETYIKAFLGIQNSTDIEFDDKVAAYSSIPVESHFEFLEPILKPIHEKLAEQASVMVLPDRSLVRSPKARRCPKDFRELFASNAEFPASLRNDISLVCPELEPFSKQLEAIGVKPIQPDERLAAMRDTDWIHRQTLPWFVRLFRYLKSQRIDPVILKGLGIVPAARQGQDAQQFSCNKEQPIYFSHSGQDEEVLASVPAWLSALTPIAFMNPDFLRLLEQQEDYMGLKDWITGSLGVNEFSMEKYCSAVLSRLGECYKDIEVSKLVEATEFLVKHAGQGLDWERLPVVLSDGRTMLLQNVRQQTFSLERDGWEYTNTKIQSVVVPLNYDFEGGWQHIWQSVEDRKHFVWLLDIYSKTSIDELVRIGKIDKHPLPMKHEGIYCPQTVTEVEQDYWAPRTAQIKSEAVIDWLKSTAHKTTMWPKNINKWDFEGPKIEIEWACKKKHYEQNGNPYKIRTGRYQFSCGRSSFLEWLRNNVWLPSTLGEVRPRESFLFKQDIKEILGESVPYFEGDLPDNIIDLLGIRKQVTVTELLSLLREHSGKSDVNDDLIATIYRELHSRHNPTTRQDIQSSFANELLILARDSQHTIRWCKIAECVWDDASPVLGDSFIYLSGQYPKLDDFFVRQLGIKLRVDKESFAQRWLVLQAEPLGGDIENRRKAVDQLYREIRPIAIGASLPCPEWWSDFSKRVNVYTERDIFTLPSQAVLPDDGELREIFKESNVEYAWRPGDDAFNTWAPFYRAIRTPLLSESVDTQLRGDAEYEILPVNRFVTPAAVKMIAAWLREKLESDYKRLFDQGVLAKLGSLEEAETSAPIEVDFRLKVGGLVRSRTVTYPLFWERNKNVLIYGVEPDKSLVAKTIARGLLSGHANKDLAHWIELVLEATDTKRLRNEGWSVPQPILDWFEQHTIPIGKQTSLLTPIVQQTAPQLPSEESALLSDQKTQSIPLQLQKSDHSEDSQDPNRYDAQRQLSEKQSTGIDSHQSNWDNTERPELPPNIQVSARKTNDTNTVSVSVAENLAASTVDYSAELAKAFVREGGAEFVDAEEHDLHHLGNDLVKNSQRRSERLASDHRNNIIHEPSPEDRRHTTERSILEGPNEQVRVSLLEWYHGKCQICNATWPKQDGEPFFTAAYLVERQYARWLDNSGNAVCLCAEHFAQWRHAAKSAPLDIEEQIRSLRLRTAGGDGDLAIYFTLLGKDVAIRYDERHFLALRTLLDVADESRHHQLPVTGGEEQHAH